MNCAVQDPDADSVITDKAKKEETYKLLRCCYYVSVTSSLSLLVSLRSGPALPNYNCWLHSEG